MRDMAVAAAAATAAVVAGASKAVAGASKVVVAVHETAAAASVHPLVQGRVAEAAGTGAGEVPPCVHTKAGAVVLPGLARRGRSRRFRLSRKELRRWGKGRKRQALGLAGGSAW